MPLSKNIKLSCYLFANFFKNQDKFNKSVELLWIPLLELLKSVAVSHKLIISFLLASVAIAKQTWKLAFNAVHIHHSEPLQNVRGNPMRQKKRGEDVRVI